MAIKENKPNIKFIGKRVIDRRTRKLIRDDAPVERIAGAVKIELPAAELQRSKRLFYHEKAAEIVAMFPQLYKPVIQKGK